MSLEISIRVTEPAETGKLTLLIENRSVSALIKPIQVEP